MRKPKLIYYNDSRHYLMYRFDPTPSIHRLRQPVDEILGTGVDTLAFGLASGQTFLHDTKVGLKWGERVEKHDHGVMWWRAAANLERALEAGYDPLKVVIDRAHEKGVQVVCSLRMNDPASPKGENMYFLGRLKWEHPEVMIGEEDPNKPGAATCANYALPEVRRERLAVIEEVCDRYGADGLEMDDYVRVFFKPSEARKNAPILTDFVREVRDLLDRIGSKRGKQLMLAARVHPSEEANLAVGMDVRAWLEDGLVNLVTPQYGGAVFDTEPSIGWLAEVAHEAGAWVYAPLGQSPYDDRNHTPTIEMYRAAASNLHASGADGVYLSALPWPHTEREYLVMRELGDPDIYARKPKHFFPGQRDPESGPFSPERHLPVTLEEGVSATVPILAGDDVDAAREDGELERVTLGVRVVQTCPEDRLSFRFNGQELPVDQRRVRTYYGGLVSYTAKRGGLPDRLNTHYWFEFDIPVDLVQQGVNEVGVTMDHHFKAMTSDRVLQQVELRITYKEPPATREGQM